MSRKRDNNHRKMKVLLISMILLCSNQSINSLKLVSINHINNIDLTTEARLVNSALADVSSTIKSSHSFIGVDEAESILKQKSFQRLRNSIDRWNQIGDRFNNAKNNNQQSLLDEVSKSIAVSKALLGHFLYRSKQESQALSLLESACPLLWGTIYDIEIDILLDCYTALGNMYLKRDMQTSLEAIQIDLITYMPWLKYALIDNAIEKSHSIGLNSIELIKLVIDLTALEREIISTETRRAWTNIDEIRLSMTTLVAEFSVSSSKEKKLSVLNKSKQIVDDLLERHKIASVEAMKKLVSQLKNSTIAINDIPQGLNEGNVDEHIIKISSSIIDYLKVEIEKEAIYYLDMMEGIIENGKLYNYLQVMKKGNQLSNMSQKSHGFQSKADVFQVMDYIITKHENYNQHNSFAPFSNKKNPTFEKNTQQSTKKNNDKDKDKDYKEKKSKSKNGFYDSYSIVFSAIVGIAILCMTKLLNTASNKQSSARINKSKRFTKVTSQTELQYLAFIKRIKQFFNNFLKYDRKLANDPSSEFFDELILKELEEKEKPTKKISGKKDKNSKENRGPKKKKSDPISTTSTNISSVESKSTEHETSDMIMKASDELRNVSSSSSEMSLYSKHYHDNNYSNGTNSGNLSINTSISQYSDNNKDLYSIIGSNDSDEKWIVTGSQNRKKTKSPTDKLPATHNRKENFDNKNSLSQKSNKNYQNQEKSRPRLKPKASAVSPAAPNVSNNRSNNKPLSSQLSERDYKPITSSELPSSNKGYATSSSSSSPSNRASQTSVSSTDIEDRSTDESDQSIDNDQSPFISQQHRQYFMGHPNFQGFSNEVPLDQTISGGGEAIPGNPIINPNAFYGMNIPPFPLIPNGNVMNPPIYTFQGPDGQVYIMPHPMHMPPPYISGFMPPMPPPYIHPGNFTSTTPPLPTENRDELISRIRLQIEYYFSDENLSKDQYLRSNMDDDGYVTLAKINSFRRIQQLRADTSMVLEAVNSSSKLRVIEIHEDDESSVENNLEKIKICSITWKKS